MVDVKKHIFLRDARDRLIDLLGLGETYPLRDLPVDVERLIAPEGAGATIPIHASQRDCVYSLWERETETATAAAEHGTGETLLLESPTVTENTGYRIRATRDTTGRWDYLHEIAEITMGLNTGAGARVLSGSWLDERLEAPTPSDARVVDHGTEVEVELPATQLGVAYRLVRVVDGAHETLSQEDAAGTFKAVVLRTQPMTEDTILRVLVFSTTDATKQDLFDISLPVVVRPARQRSVSVLPGHHVEHQENGTIVIGDSQPGIRYQLYALRLDAGNLLLGGAPAEGSPEDWVEVAGEEDRVFHVQRRVGAATWVDLPGFLALGDPAEGTGAALSIPTGPLEDDCMIVVRAWRDVPLSDGATVTLAVPLWQEAIVLVRPDPAPALRLQALVDEATTSGALRLIGGQRGVFYHLRTSADGADLGRSGYFYERHGVSPEVNRGIGSQAIGLDLVVARDPWTVLAAPELRGIEALALEVDFAISQDRSGFVPVSGLLRATTPPEPPIVDTPTLAGGTTLHLRAVKGRTRLAKALDHTAEIVAPPVISAQTEAPGGPIVGVVVASSRVGEVYSLRVNGAVDGSVQAGNGQDLTLPVSSPSAGAIVEVQIARGEHPAIVVEELCRVVAT